MPLFYFNIRGGDHFDDRQGTVLEDVEEARTHARLIAGDLMRNRERKVRHWRIEVRNEAGLLVFEALFAGIDDSLAHLDPGARGTIERLRGSMAGLADAFRDCQMSFLKTRAIMAQGAKKPYLVAVEGRRVTDV